MVQEKSDTFPLSGRRLQVTILVHYANGLHARSRDGMSYGRAAANSAGRPASNGARGVGPQDRPGRTSLSASLSASSDSL